MRICSIVHQPLQVPKEYFEKFAPLVHDDKPMYTRQVYVSQVALFPLPLCTPESSNSPGCLTCGAAGAVFFVCSTRW